MSINLSQYDFTFSLCEIKITRFFLLTNSFITFNVTISNSLLRPFVNSSNNNILAPEQIDFIKANLLICPPDSLLALKDNLIFKKDQNICSRYFHYQCQSLNMNE